MSHNQQLEVVGSEQTEYSQDKLVVTREELRLMVNQEVRRLLGGGNLGEENLLTGMNRRNYEQRSLKLKFFNKISSPVFTGRKIKGKECESIKVALVDGVTEQVVRSGPEASAKVEVVVLEGGLESVGAENWTPEEFEKKIVREKSLLMGTVYLYLKEGIGFLGEIHLRHTKIYRKNCEFRLGAKIVDSFAFVGVKEATTESFLVKDGRRTYYEKHCPPSPSDRVWRLEMIAKNGRYHQRLKDANIKTVKEFLNHFYEDAQGLQKILKAREKAWEVIVLHAQQCTIDIEADVHTSVVSVSEHQEYEVSSDDKKALEVGSTQLSNDFNPSNSPMMESTSGDNSATSQITHCEVPIHPDHDVHIQPSTYSPVDNDVLMQPSVSSPGTGGLQFIVPEGPNSFDDTHFESVVNAPTSVSRQDYDSWLSDIDIDPTFRGFMNSYMAQTRWKKVSSVLRWFLIFLIKKKIVALEGIHVEKKQRLS